MANCKTLIFAALFSIYMLNAVEGVEPHEQLKNPVLEERARVLSKNIRCLVCQNQSIDDSNAILAKDLRAIVRERLLDGDSDSEVFDFLVKRYGDFILLTPPLKPETYILWYGPGAFFIIGLIMILFLIKRRRTISPEPSLSDQEKINLSKIINQIDRK